MTDKDSTGAASAAPRISLHSTPPRPPPTETIVHFSSPPATPADRELAERVVRAVTITIAVVVAIITLAARAPSVPPPGDWVIPVESSSSSGDAAAALSQNAAGRIESSLAWRGTVLLAWPVLYSFFLIGFAWRGIRKVEEALRAAAPPEGEDESGGRDTATSDAVESGAGTTE